MKGTRIERPDEGQDQQDADDDADADDGGQTDDADDAVDADLVADLEPEFRFVRRVRVVEVGLGDFPINDLESRAADNVVTYVWKDPKVVSAASSTRFTPDADVEMMMTVSTEGGAIDVSVVIRNITTDERVRVDGRIVHEVTDDAGRGGRLVSDPIDKVLSPGGETTVHFSYVLPDGNYTATAAFEAAN